MAAISSCPLCAKQVSVPIVHPDSQVRCPLCRGEFRLQAALDLAPPMLEVLESPAGAHLDFNEASGNGLAVAMPAMAAAGGSASSPMFTEELSFDAPPADEFDAESLDEPDTELEGKSPSIDDLMAEPAANSDFDLSEAPADESPFSLGGVVGIEDGESIATGHAEEGAVPEFSASSAAKRRKREPSFIGNLIGVVGGGVVGCGLAYFIVLWVGGPDKDFLELGPKLPKWMLPASFSKPMTAAAVTPVSNSPTPGDLNEVKQAVPGNDDEPALKLNVPSLPEEPKGEDLSDGGKLPFDTKEEPASTDDGDSLASPEDLANDLSTDSPKIDAPIAPEVKGTSSDEAEMPADEGDEPVASADDQDHIGLKEPTTYSSADIDSALAEANTLRTELADAEGGDAKTLKGKKIQYFRKMYRLGEVVSYAADADASLAAVAELLTQLAADPTKFSQIGKAGSQWLNLDPAKQGDDKGIFLAGKVEEVAKSGNLFRVRLLTSGDNTPISIYAPNRPDLTVGDNVLLLGSIIIDPQEKLYNFRDDEKTVVWHGLSVKAGK